jgi:hypothetical protein
MTMVVRPGRGGKPAVLRNEGPAGDVSLARR